ncbi:MAG TPA: adenylate/guanylate cyclase domain-containing protein [Candidatus Limnocylindrales bacterium]|nr:adenylate/guanylate cyclase domain-containing protein [Candidatus Limnocylindrales bacterium]
MTFRNSIGARIFGLAVFLLTLTIALVGFLLWQVDRLEEELQTLTHVDIPLATSLSNVNEYGLRRRLAFERTFGALSHPEPNQTVLTEAQANYEEFTGLLNDELARAATLLSPDAIGARAASEALELSTLLRQVEAAYPAITAQQAKVLDLQRQGDHAAAVLVADGLNQLQRLVQTQRAELQTITTRRAEHVAREALERQGRIVRLSVAATASTVLLGLLVAMVVTRALLRPVHSLIGALGNVQKGQLDLELPVRSKDELGALTTSFNFFVGELRAKEQMRETFGRYVDPRILKRLLDADITGEDGGREMMTVSFGDIVGFTALSERLTPANMVRLLNRHFGLQALAVQEYQGIVDKFIGDSIMAFWGPPFVEDAEHAVLACRAALAQLVAIDTLRSELPELTGLRRDTPVIDLRLGLALGEVIVGNIGSDHTRSYTVIGDTVNLAARLEAANRFYGTRILVSDSVAREAGPQFEMREIDTIAVKGKIETVDVFELLGETGCLDDVAQRARDTYADGLRCYRAGSWDAAFAAFSQSLAARPADRAAEVMLERIAEFREKPPSGWDGVWRPQTK